MWSKDEWPVRDSNWSLQLTSFPPNTYSLTGFRPAVMSTPLLQRITPRTTFQRLFLGACLSLCLPSSLFIQSCINLFCLAIYPSDLYPPSSQSINLPNPPVHPCIDSSMHAWMHASFLPSIHPPIHPSIHPYIHPSILSIHSYIHPYIHPSIHPAVHPSIHDPSVHPSTNAFPSIHHPSIHQPIQPSVHPALYTYAGALRRAFFGRCAWAQAGVWQASTSARGLQHSLRSSEASACNRATVVWYVL